MKSTLNNWLTASAGETDHLFYYDKNWGTLIGYDASYGSDQELNDHHFHYGYFIAAAATLAKFDPGWARSSQYGGMIDLLIRDANNYDRSDTRFPYLRDFDIYAGHDWASGHGSFASRQQPGVELGGDELRRRPDPVGPGDREHGGPGRRNLHLHDPGGGDRGLLVRRRQHDLPERLRAHRRSGMVWGDGGAYATWFSADPEKIQGINQLPITGSHLYLGLRPGVQQDQLQRDRPQPGR